MSKKYKYTYNSEKIKEVHERNREQLELRLYGVIVDMVKKVSCLEFAMMSVDPELTGKVMSNVAYDYVRSGQMN